MTTPPTTSPTSPQAPPPRIESEESWWQRWGLRLLPALTFLVGLVLGAVVVIAGQLGESVGDVVGEPSPSPSGSADPSAGVGDTVVTLPAACEGAAENITEATRLIDEAATAVRDFRPDELVDLLTRLEVLDAETRELAAECRRVDVSESALPEQTDGPTGEPTDEPSTEPTSPE